MAGRYGYVVAYEQPEMTGRRKLQLAAVSIPLGGGSR